MKFYPFENILYSCQIPTLNFLDNFQLKIKWNKDFKKILTHFILKEIQNQLSEHDYIVYTEIPKCLELFEFIEHDKILKYINTLFRKLKKILGNKILILPGNMVYPHEIENEEELAFWYGEFYDFYNIQKNDYNPNAIGNLKKYCLKHGLLECYSDLQKTPTQLL